MIYWWINIKFKSNSSDINYYNPYLNKHYLKRYIQSIWYSISYKYFIHFTQSTETSEGITKINYGWRKENKSKENIGIQKDYSPLRLISVSNQNIQVSIFYLASKIVWFITLIDIQYATLNLYLIEAANHLCE